MTHTTLMTKYACIALCFGMGLSLSVTAGGRSNLVAPIDKTKRNMDEASLSNDDDNSGLQQTLNLNFSPEHREKLRQALDDYARSVDPGHDRIEEKRRAMQDSIERRFFDADSDGDSTIDRQEATEKLPQIARHFSAVDTNQDNLISLNELVEAQSRILERRKAADALLEEQKRQQKSIEIKDLTPPKPNSKRLSQRTKN